MFALLLEVMFVLLFVLTRIAVGADGHDDWFVVCVMVCTGVSVVVCVMSSVLLCCCVLCVSCKMLFAL